MSVVLWLFSVLCTGLSLGIGFIGGNSSRVQTLSQTAEGVALALFMLALLFL
jgi:hypothetical protein